MAENGDGLLPLRHGRACPGHLRFDGGGWMAGTRPAMTIERRSCIRRPLAPAKPHFRGRMRRTTEGHEGCERARQRSTQAVLQTTGMDGSELVRADRVIHFYRQPHDAVRPAPTG